MGKATAMGADVGHSCQGGAKTALCPTVTPAILLHPHRRPPHLRNAAVAAGAPQLAINRPVGLGRQQRSCRGFEASSGVARQGQQRRAVCKQAMMFGSGRVRYAGQRWHAQLFVRRGASRQPDCHVTHTPAQLPTCLRTLAQQRVQRLACRVQAVCQRVPLLLLRHPAGQQGQPVS